VACTVQQDSTGCTVQQDSTGCLFNSDCSSRAAKEHVTEVWAHMVPLGMPLSWTQPGAVVAACTPAVVCRVPVRGYSLVGPHLSWATAEVNIEVQNASGAFQADVALVGGSPSAVSCVLVVPCCCVVSSVSCRTSAHTTRLDRMVAYACLCCKRRLPVPMHARESLPALTQCRTTYDL
jgi:hypothetical protein